MSDQKKTISDQDVTALRKDANDIFVSVKAFQEKLVKHQMLDDHLK